MILETWNIKLCPLRQVLHTPQVSNNICILILDVQMVKFVTFSYK